MNMEERVITKTIQDKIADIQTNVNNIRDAINSKYINDVLKNNDKLENYQYFINNLNVNMDVPDIALSKYTTTISYNKQFVKLFIRTAGAWMIEYDDDWVTPNVYAGYGETEVIITVDYNWSLYPRTAKIVFSLPYFMNKEKNPSKILMINQNQITEEDISIGEYGYCSEPNIYFDTNIIPDRNTKVEVLFDWLGETNNYSLNGPSFSLFGCGSANGFSPETYYSFIKFSSAQTNNNMKGCIGGSKDYTGVDNYERGGTVNDTPGASSGWMYGKKDYTNMLFTMDGNNARIQADGLSEIILNEFNDETWANYVPYKSLYLLARNGNNVQQTITAGYPATPLKIKYFKIYQNDELIRYYIPAYDFNLKGSLYDKVNGEFECNMKDLSGFVIENSTSFSYISLSKELIEVVNDDSGEITLFGENLQVTSSPWIDVEFTDDTHSVLTYHIHADYNEIYREGFIKVYNDTTERICTVKQGNMKNCKQIQSIISYGSTRNGMGVNNEYAGFIDTEYVFSSDDIIEVDYMLFSKNDTTYANDVCWFGAREEPYARGRFSFDVRKSNIYIANADVEFACYKIDMIPSSKQYPLNCNFIYRNHKLQVNGSPEYNVGLADNFMSCISSFHINGMHITEADDSSNIYTFNGGTIGWNRICIYDKYYNIIRYYLPVLVNDETHNDVPALLDIYHGKIYYNKGSNVNVFGENNCKDMNGEIQIFYPDNVTPYPHQFGYIDKDGTIIGLRPEKWNEPWIEQVYTDDVNAKIRLYNNISYDDSALIAENSDEDNGNLIFINSNANLRTYVKIDYTDKNGVSRQVKKGFDIYNYMRLDTETNIVYNIKGETHI